MNLSEAVKYVEKLDYPCENYKNIPEYFDVIKNSTGVTFTTDFPYSYLTLYKPKQLGLYILDRECMNNSHSVCSSINIKVRAKSRRYDDVSPYSYWTNNKKKVIDLACKQLEKYKDTYKPHELPIEFISPDATGLDNLEVTEPIEYTAHKSLENECSLCLYRLGMPAAFPSLLATKMLTPLKIQNNGDLRVLDISAGWGDRLVACCAMDIKYMACDPNTDLEPCYAEIISKYGDQLKQHVYTIPFEDYIPTEADRYNCLYTSPPFFDLEIYSDQSTQSTTRYKTLDLWENKFLKPCLAKSDSMLDPGSHIYLHLSDIVNKDKKVIYVERVINFCKTKLGWTFHGVYGHTVQDINKESETPESREEINKVLLKPTNFVKKYINGVRVNKNNQALAQTIWYFTK
jgi:hypothetical protein